MGFLVELVSYLGVVGSTFFGVIGLISTVFWMLEMTPLRIPKLPPRYLGIAAFVCLTMAQFQVWKDEHFARITAEAIRPATTAPMQPLVEGLTATYRQVPSTRTDLPFAIEVTIQVQTELSPFGVGIICDQPITGTYLFPSPVLMDVKEGYVIEAPGRSYSVTIGSPPMTPKTPLSITLFSKEAFHILKINRVVL